MRHSSAAALLLVLPAFGFTDCQYFSTTPVPAVDTTPPLVATRMWIDGVESIRFGTVEQIFDGDSSFVVAPAVWDSGGVQFMLFSQSVTVQCHDFDTNPQLGQLTTVDFFDRSQTQVGGVGTIVSNGIYFIGDVTELGSFADLCEPGFDLVSIRYDWETSGHDFAGHAIFDTGTFFYEP